MHFTGVPSTEFTLSSSAQTSIDPRLVMFDVPSSEFYVVLADGHM